MPSQVITGTQLLRMLQKHYGRFDGNDLLSECVYWALYANAAYGIALYSMSKPCAMCCAPLCCLPFADNGDDDSDRRILRDSKCCGAVQLNNSARVSADHRVRRCAERCFDGVADGRTALRQFLRGGRPREAVIGD